MSEQSNEQDAIDSDRRMTEDAEIRLKVKTRESNWFIAFMALAFLFVVVGVVVPVWMDKADSDQRREDLDQIAQNTQAIGKVVQRMDADDSPEAQQLLEDAVIQLIEVVRCDNRANLDDLLDELEAGGIILAVEDPLTCVPAPTFDLPPPADGGG